MNDYELGQLCFVNMFMNKTKHGTLKAYELLFNKNKIIIYIKVRRGNSQDLVSDSRLTFYPASKSPFDSKVCFLKST